MTFPDRSPNARSAAKGLRRFLDDEQERAWMEGETELAEGDRSDADDLEQRFK